MTEEQTNALKALANSKYWEIVSKEILIPYFKDISQPDDEFSRRLVSTHPDAAYIGRLFAHTMLINAIDNIDKFKNVEPGKQEPYN